MCQMWIKDYIRGAGSPAPQGWKPPQLETKQSGSTTRVMPRLFTHGQKAKA